MSLCHWLWFWQSEWWLTSMVISEKTVLFCFAECHEAAVAITEHEWLVPRIAPLLERYSCMAEVQRGTRGLFVGREQTWSRSETWAQYLFRWRIPWKLVSWCLNWVVKLLCTWIGNKSKGITGSTRKKTKNRKQKRKRKKKKFHTKSRFQIEQLLWAIM